MKTSVFNYNLPSELIAQHPAIPRDSSRLMIVDKKSRKIEHKIFHDIINYLKPGDLIVWNNSKVFKARLFGELEPLDKSIEKKSAQMKEQVKKDSSSPSGLARNKLVEIFLVRPMENEGVWKVLAKPGRHVKPGMRVKFAPDFYCDVMLKEPTGDILVQFPYNAETVREKANEYGHIPVPPYVKDEPDQLEIYQTVYAKPEGSVAAPTAGFHFTPELIQKLKDKGVEFAEVTLHVGLGTFLPVKSERVEDHTMHSEWVELTEENVDKINKAKREGRRVIAVGTTTVRTLEGVAQMFSPPCRGRLVGGLSPDKTSPLPSPTRRGDFLKAYTGDINIFITPGFEFKVVDAMITNFHLPKSTLLMLVSAFANDREFMLECYKKAVDEKYRFYSFGDAMLITTHDSLSTTQTNCEFEEKFREALEFLRNSDIDSPNKPVIPHDERVGEFLFQKGFEDDVVIAGILHDMLEWSSVTENQLRKKFGDKIVEIIKANTKDRSIENKEERRKNMIKKCNAFGDDAMAVKIADVLDSFIFYSLNGGEKELERCRSYAGLLIENISGKLKIVFEEDLLKIFNS